MEHGEHGKDKGWISFALSSVFPVSYSLLFSFSPFTLRLGVCALKRKTWAHKKTPLLTCVNSGAGTEKRPKSNQPNRYEMMNPFLDFSSSRVHHIRIVPHVQLFGKIF
jgi:hypothetical protein